MVDISKLDYNKLKIIVSLVPIKTNPFWFFQVSVKNDFDWYEEGDTFIPCFKTLGKFLETIYVEERSNKLNRLKDDYELKRISTKYKNKFIIGETKFPSFYGYFSSNLYFNREYKKLKRFILNTILKREGITDHSIIEEIDSFYMDET